MTLGYFSPMPPEPTGVADYSAALVPYLKALGEVRVNEPGDRNLYHSGNNHLHRAIYAQALAHPGTLVIHDAVLHHFMLGTLSEDEYIAEFAYNYGDADKARELWWERARSGIDPKYFAYPMLKRVVERSRNVIVHNPAAARIVRAHVGSARVIEIPHLLRPSPPDSGGSVRGHLEIPESAFLIGSFGFQRETKRVSALLRAFHGALQRGADLYLLVAGAFVSSAHEKSVAALLDHPRIRRTPYLPEVEFWSHARALDACVNLRYPTAGETSGVAISMMGLGKPVIFTAGEEVSRYPENSCLRVDAGPAEEDALAMYLEWLASNRDVARAIGERAASHIHSEHAPEKVARQFWEAV